MVLLRGTMGRTMAVIRKAPGKWLLWSTVAFGIFYAPFAFAAAYGPSWLVSGTYQFTMFAGALLTPCSGRSGRRRTARSGSGGRSPCGSSPPSR